MTALLANIFLGCFLFGFLWSVFSFLFGMDHGVDHGGSLHIGDHDFSIGDHGDVGHVDHAGGSDGGHDGVHARAPFFSINGIMMFMTWFGAVGYAFNRSASGLVLVTLAAAIGAGFVGAGALFLFMNKVMLKGETPMNPADYYLPGTIARVTSGIRRGGVGEIVYEQGGTRKTLGARSEDDAGFRQGEEVVIVRCERGIAYVKSLAGELAGSSEPVQ